jgi:hypothetical protein
MTYSEFGPDSVLGSKPNFRGIEGVHRLEGLADGGWALGSEAELPTFGRGFLEAPAGTAIIDSVLRQGWLAFYRNMD